MASFQTRLPPPTPVLNITSIVHLLILPATSCALFPFQLHTQSYTSTRYGGRDYLFCVAYQHIADMGQLEALTIQALVSWSPLLFSTDLYNSAHSCVYYPPLTFFFNRAAPPMTTLSTALAPLILSRRPRPTTRAVGPRTPKHAGAIATSFSSLTTR